MCIRDSYWSDSALLSASGFVRKVSDYTRPGLLLEEGRWVQTSVNDGSAVARGLELEAKFPLKAVMQTAHALDLRASVTRNWSRVDAVPGPYNRLNQQLPLTATLGADYKSADGVLTAGGSFIFKRGGVMRINTARASSGSTVRDTMPASSSRRTWVVIVGCEQWSSAARSDIRASPWSSIVDSSLAWAYPSGMRTR